MYDAHIVRINKRPGDQAQILLHRKLVDKFVKYQSPNLSNIDVSVLEIGSGSGRVALEFLKRGYEYSAIEPTNVMRITTISNLKNAGFKSPTFKMYSDRLPSISKNLENKFDFVVMIHVLEHAKHGYEAREWLESIKKTLKPGGLVLVVSPDSTDYKWNFFDCDWSHSFPTTLSNVSELLTDVDFKILRSSGIRSWLSNPPAKFFLKLIRQIFPFKTINILGKIVFKQELLGTGFGAGFLFQNIFIIAKNEN
jgi:SAM-dependent methyltransferase